MKFNGTEGERKIEFIYRKNSTALQVNAFPYPNRTSFKVNLYEYVLDSEQCSAKGCGCLIEEMSNAKLIARGVDLLSSVSELIKELEFHGYNNSTAINNAEQLIKEITEL